nr:MAG TPA: hypothetical protein [Caudoviricetes sp.]
MRRGLLISRKEYLKIDPHQVFYTHGNFPRRLCRSIRQIDGPVPLSVRGYLLGFSGSLRQ